MPEICMRTAKLTKAQDIQIQELERVCKKEDPLLCGIQLDPSWNIDPSFPCFFLLYYQKTAGGLKNSKEDRVLAAALSIFMPSWEEAEIMAYTHPRFRRRGYFSKLREKAYQMLSNSGVTNIKLKSEPTSRNVLEVARHIGGVLWYSDYLMNCNCEKINYIWRKSESAEAFLFAKKEKYSFKQELIKLHQEAFLCSEEEAKEFIKEVIYDTGVRIYGYRVKGKIVSMCCVQYTQEKAVLFGMCTKPSSQKKGYGEELLRFVLIQLKYSMQEEGRICLHVDGRSEAAYYLYKKMGFQIQQQIDYWKI